MRVRREALILTPDHNLSATAEKKFIAALTKRLHHEPLAYILGTTPFLDRMFVVNRHTLIPRPATELITEHALAALEEKNWQAVTIDVGTGSGCIAISMAASRRTKRVFATDTSASALLTARKNARTHHSASKIIFRKGSLLAPLRSTLHINTAPIIIIANLPYIPTSDMRRLPPDIRRFEPRSALIGGKDGLTPYRSLILEIFELGLRQPISLFLEILPNQYLPIAAILQKSFPSCRTEMITNFEGICIGLRADLNT
jgi:release factor glutamine methyltransferase